MNVPWNWTSCSAALPPAGSVLTADGTPVRDATVTLTNVHGEVVATTRSGREGGYVITELVAGEYTLAGSAPAFR